MAAESARSHRLHADFAIKERDVIRIQAIPNSRRYDARLDAATVVRAVPADAVVGTLLGRAVSGAIAVQG